MSRSQFQSKRFILRHAWLNLWDERMTTGRINQVAIFLQLLDQLEIKPSSMHTNDLHLHTLTKPLNPRQLQSKLCNQYKLSTNSFQGVLLFDPLQNLLSSKTTCNNRLWQRQTSQKPSRRSQVVPKPTKTNSNYKTHTWIYTLISPFPIKRKIATIICANTCGAPYFHSKHQMTDTSIHIIHNAVCNLSCLFYATTSTTTLSHGVTVHQHPNPWARLLVQHTKLQSNWNRLWSSQSNPLCHIKNSFTAPRQTPLLPFRYIENRPNSFAFCIHCSSSRSASQMSCPSGININYYCSCFLACPASFAFGCCTFSFTSSLSSHNSIQ